MPVIGFLRPTPAAGFEYILNAFRQGLNDAGFVEGKNVAIEYRWADNQPDRLPGLAADLVRRQVAAIVGAGVRCRTQSKPQPDDADHIRHGSRSCQNRPGRKPQPTRRQHHGRRLYIAALAAKLLRAAARVGSQRLPSSPCCATQTILNSG